jgi:hypothetical protein
MSLLPYPATPAHSALQVLLRHCRVTGQPLSNLKDSIGQLSSKEDQATMRRLLHSSIAMQDMVGHIKDDSGRCGMYNS